MNMTCSSCKFWKATSYIDGECRKSAPVHVALGLHGDAPGLWPNTNHDDWCGDFEKEGKNEPKSA